jgi:hypothetical protein
MTTDAELQRIDAEGLTRRMLASVINSLQEKRQLVEHREEVEYLLEHDEHRHALALVLCAGRRQNC